MSPCKSTELKEYTAQLHESVDLGDQEHGLIAGIEQIVREEIACLRVAVSLAELKILIQKSKDQEALLMRDVFPQYAKEAGFIIYKLDDDFKELMGKYIQDMVRLFSLRFIHKSEAESNIGILENGPLDGSMELSVKFGKNSKGDYFIRSVKITPVEKYNPDDPNMIINGNLG